MNFLTKEIKYMRSILYIFVLFLTFVVQAQGNYENKEKLKIGFNYGYGNEGNFLINSDSYTYEGQFYKIQLNYRVIQKRKWDFEINVEPSIYLYQYQLLDAPETIPIMGNELLENQTVSSEKNELNEYVLNLGFIARYKLINNLSTYSLISVGPMYSDKDTERMNAGFAFSDVMGLGLGYKVEDIFLDLRFSVRHVSNAGFSSPNRGYNSANLEMGFSCSL